MDCRLSAEVVNLIYAQFLRSSQSLLWLTQTVIAERDYIMKDKTRKLLQGEIQITPFNEFYNEIDQKLFLSKNLYNTCKYG